MKEVCEKTSSCLGATSDNIKKAQVYIYDQSVSTIEKIPKWFEYCCVFNCYRKHKSIDDTEEKDNNTNNNSTPIIPIQIVSDINKQRHQQSFSTVENVIYSMENNVHIANENLSKYPENQLISQTSTPINYPSDSISKNTCEYVLNGNAEILNCLNQDLTESSEISSDERLSSSGHSTPTRPLGELTTSSINLKNQEYHTNHQLTPQSTKSKEMSRPQSSYSSKSFMIHDNDDASTIDTSEIDENLEILESIEYPQVLKSEECSLDTKSIGTESRTETEHYSIETVIVTTPKEEFKNISETVDEELKSGNPEEYKVQKSNPTPPPLLRESSLINKSSESIYQEKQVKETNFDLLSSASTETSSDYQASAASLDCSLDKSQFSPIKLTPLIQKSKTTLFGRKSRRVSPVKQAIKLSKTELYPPTLTKFDKPKEGLNITFQQLESPNWETVIDGLVGLVKLMRHHPEYLDTQCHVVCLNLSKTVKNLRSQVSRAACQASTEYFSLRSKFIEQECDNLVGSLLHRTADTNRFLRADAGRALESMCDNLTPQKVLTLLITHGVSHQNSIVRTSSAKLLNRLVERMGSDKVYNMAREHKEKIFLTGANLLLEGSLETRSYAKAFLRILSDHPHYSKSILEYIPPRTYRNIEKTLRSIR